MIYNDPVVGWSDAERDGKLIYKFNRLLLIHFRKLKLIMKILRYSTCLK